MPCRCDYMEPNKHEKESRKLAEIVKFVYSKTGRKIPNFIQDAVKSIYGMNIQAQGTGAPLQTYLDQYTKDLCQILRDMDEDTKSILLVDSKDLRSWYDRHKAADASRHKIETDATYRDKLLKTAMSKLTDEERIAVRYYFIDKS